MSALRGEDRLKQRETSVTTPRIVMVGVRFVVLLGGWAVVLSRVNRQR